MEKFSIYIPMDRRQALVRGKDLPQRTTGSALLADISGFTPFTAALAQELGPQRGAEELTAQLNRVYGALIAEVHSYGGSVVSFSGDAITCWFDGDNGHAALTCALAMQAVMGQLAAATTPTGTVFELAIKVTVVQGPAQRLLVGDPAIQLIDVLAGQTLDTLALLARCAMAGEVIVSADLVAQAELGISITAWRDDPNSGSKVAVVESLQQPAAPRPWPTLDLAGVPVAQLRPWLLPPIYAWLHSNPDQFLAELRPVAALFLSFHGIDYDHDPIAHERLDAYIRWVQHTVSRYAGSLVQVTTGDKGCYLYATFGAPIANDDDATRAVATALELYTPPPQLSFVSTSGIGITYGQMYSGAYGSATHCTYGVLGDKTNLAARLMELAQSAGILCDDETYRRTQHRWDFEVLPPVRVKGKAGMIRIYRPTRKAITGSLAGSEAATHLPLNLRSAEIAQLEVIIDTLSYGVPRVLFIEGEAGIGKSALVGTLVRLMQKRGLSGLSGAGQSIETHTPYRAWRDIFASFFALDEIGDPLERQHRVRDLMQELAPRHIQRLPLLNDVLNLGLPDTPLTATLEPALRQESLQAFLTDLLLAWAREQPLVLVLEDAHWIDELSWALALQVARAARVAQAPLLLVVVSRPLHDQSSAQANILRSLDIATTIHLGPLSPAETVALAAARLGVPIAALPPAVATLVQQRAEGNPFFAEELVLTLRDQGLITVLPDPSGNGTLRCHVNGDIAAAHHTLPDTLQGLILARIDRLRPEQQLAVKVAAVIGRSFAYATLAYTVNRYIPIDHAVLQQHMLAIAQIDLIVVDQSEPGFDYSFKHVITQEVAYQMQLFAQRKQMHRIVAEWYEMTYGPGGEEAPQAERLALYYPLLAYHYQQAEDRSRERHYATLSGKQAAAQYANTTAIAYFSRALELTPSTSISERYELLLAREQVYHLLGGREAQRQDLTALTALAERLNDDRRRAEVALRWTAYAEAIGDYPAAQAAAQQAVEWASAAGDTTQEAWGHQLGGVICWLDGNPQARSQLEKALELARAVGLTEVEAKSLANLGNIAWSGEDYQRAQEYYEQALALLRAIGQRRSEGVVLNNLGIIANILGDYASAQNYYQQALSRSREIGDRRGESKALNSLGSLVDGWGDYSSARSYYEQALVCCQEIGDRSGESETLTYLGMLLYHLGDYPAAQSSSTQALAIAQEIGSRADQATALLALGNILAALNQPAAAAAAFRQALDMRNTLGQPTLALEARAGLARIALSQGDLRQALCEVELIIADLDTESLDGAYEPFRIYLTCYQVLHVCQDVRAIEIVRTAYHLLQDRAAKIADPHWRDSFLTQVATHHEIGRVYQELFATSADSTTQPQGWYHQETWANPYFH